MSESGPNTSRYSRREFLQAAGVGTLLVAGGPALAACSSSASSGSGAAATSSPRHGGVLRAGLTGGGSTDTLDPHRWISNVDASRVYQLFESLTAFDEKAQPQLQLAEEIESNKDATLWTVRVKSGITFHNGKPLGADDVIYTYQRITNPKNPTLGTAGLQAVNVAGMKKLDSRTVQIPCHYPYSGFFSLQACQLYFIVPVGFDVKNPVGTGPFKYKSFNPGVQSVFTKYDNYWQPGLPYLDEVIISDYADESSQINGLLSGQLGVVDSLSGSSIQSVESGGGNIQIANGGGYAPFTMRTDVAPFNDVRVRQAFRLLVDREQMRDTVFDGHGLIGNDLFAPFDPLFASLPQRQADVEQAKFLLKKAGHEGLNVTLITADLTGGSISAATVFAQQAKAAGVTVHLQQIPVSTFFGPNYLRWPFAQDVWGYFTYILNVQEALLPPPYSTFNECHVDYEPFNKLYKQLISTTDSTTAKQIAHEMQLMEYEGYASGYIIPYFPPAIDGYGKNVHGLQPSLTGFPLGDFNFRTIWMS
jgi:peptide/nickel transport system substrate-binding protein